MSSPDRKRVPETGRAPESETRLFREVFRHPDRLRERLILAIALAPPKAIPKKPPGRRS